MRKKLVIVVGSLAMLVVAAGVVLTTLGLYRYGGVEGLTDRIRLQFASEQPHGDYVPTPASAADDPNPEQLAVLMAGDTVPTIEPTSQIVEATSTPGTTNRTSRQLASLNQPASEIPARPSAKPTATPLPPTATATTKPEPAATLAPAARDVSASSDAQGSGFPATLRLDGMEHYWQTWNNCGPATLSMNLSYFGIKIGQDKIGAILKPEKDDKNVGPEQLVDFARSQGLTATVRVNGDSTRLKALLEAGIPVLVETWYEPKPNDGMGHYKLIVGYDDGDATGGGYWIAYDSYDSHGLKKGDPYQGVTFPYEGFDPLWKVFNYTYVPIYDESRAAAVEAVLGDDLDDAKMWQRSLAENLAYVKANPKDPFAWFNVGTDYVAQGDYQSASQAYDAARRLKLPWRMLWYQFGPFEAYYQMGRHQEVIDLADATIKTAVNDEELFYWKGLAQQALGDAGSAKASLQQAVKLRPTYQDALDALAKLQ